jgi:hypothetical protein
VRVRGRKEDQRHGERDYCTMRRKGLEHVRGW